MLKSFGEGFGACELLEVEWKADWDPPPLGDPHTCSVHEDQQLADIGPSKISMETFGPRPKDP